MSWLRRFLNRGMSGVPGAPDSLDDAAVQAAVQSGDTSAVTSLIKRGAEADSILHTAAQHGTPTILRWLLEHGANPNSTATNGVTPLLVAEEAGREDLATIIAERGGRGVAPCARCGGIACRGCGKILRACQCGVRLSFGPGDPRCRQCESGAKEVLAAEQATEPLHRAAASGDLAEVKKLIRAGWKVDALDSDGNTPLHAAVFGGNEDVVRFLLDEGADVNAEGHEGLTATVFAYTLGRDEVALLLESYGGL